MGHKQTNKQFGGRTHGGRNNHSQHNRLKKVPDDVDGRSKDSQKFRDIVTSTILLAGNHLTPEITEQLAKQFAGLVIRQDRHQSRMFNKDGRGVNDHAYCKLVNSANRCLRLLGLTKTEENTDDGDIMALERYCARNKRPVAGKSKRKKDHRRERLGKNL